MEQTKEDIDCSQYDSGRRSQFLNALSHDIRTPLNALALNITLAGLMLDAGDVASVRESLVEIKTSIASITELLGTLAGFSTLESSMEFGVISAFPLVESFSQLIAQYQSIALSKGLRLRFRCDHEEKDIITDKIALFRIVSSLLDNAIKFTVAGAVEVQTVLEDGALAVFVRDTGPGIPASFQSRLFTEFAQAGNYERDKNKGIGLGLAIIKKMITHLEGSIDVSSTDTGTIIRINIPISTGTDSADSSDSRGQ
jgi:signal transduction histidine kinase